jgi:hypothetical protein
MGRYDGPHFEVENEDVVSIWAATVTLAKIPSDYFEPRYGGEDDEPFNPFSDDFGFGCYDLDFVDTNGVDDGRLVPIEELLAPVSYSASFRAAAAQQAQQLGVGQTCYVILLYNFKYDPAVTGVRENKYMRFIGVFPYDRGE